MFSCLLCNVIFRTYFAEGDSTDTDNVRFTALEIRALAASWKAANCVSLAEVLRIASWKNAFTSHVLRDLCHQQRSLFSGLIVLGLQIIRNRHYLLPIYGAITIIKPVIDTNHMAPPH